MLFIANWQFLLSTFDEKNQLNCVFHRCVKFEESNDLSQLIFGSVSVIQAKDALPVEVSIHFFYKNRYLCNLNISR